MKLSELRTHVYDLIGQDADVARDAFSIHLVNRHINRAARRLFEMMKRHGAESVTKTGTFDTVVDTREYNLLTVNAASMSDFDRLHRLEKEITGRDEPAPIPVDRALERGRTDVPNRAYLRGTATLGFYRQPEEVKTFTVHYAPRFTEMDTDDDDLALTAFMDPIVPEDFQDAIIFRVAAILLGSENSPNQQWFALAGESEQNMVANIRTRRAGPRFMLATGRATQRWR